MSLPRKDTEYLRTYNSEYVRADFSYWLPFDSWSINQAVCLSLNRDPRKVSWKQDVFAYTDISRVAKEFGRRRALIKSAQAANRLDPPIQPELFCMWCAEKKLHIPVGMRKLVKPTAHHVLESQFGIDDVICCLERIGRFDECDFREFAEREGLSMGVPLRSWQSFADWYCFRFNIDLLDRTDAVLSSDTDAVLNPEVVPEWVMEARKFATSTVKERLKVGKRLPTQSEMASCIETEFKNSGIKTSKNKKIDASYIIRIALSKDAWWTSMKKNL